MFGVFVGAILLGLSVEVLADSKSVSVLDDRSKEVRLARPAQRIISLAPHVTELLYSAGLGDRIVGVVEYSNYPEKALSLPKVGSSHQLDYEKILGLKPDLVVGWMSGNPPEKIKRIESLGIPVFLSEPKSFEDIALTVERFAKLGASQEFAAKTLEGYRKGVSNLKQRYSGAKSVSVFYEIWNTPLMTLSGDHLFNHVLKLCGGSNIFSYVDALAPRVSSEDVLSLNPQVILASGVDEKRPQWLDDWLRWPSMQAVKNKHLYHIHPDLLQRHTLRVLKGAEQLCALLDKARASEKSKLTKVN